MKRFPFGPLSIGDGISYVGAVGEGGVLELEAHTRERAPLWRISGDRAADIYLSIGEVDGAIDLSYADECPTISVTVPRAVVAAIRDLAAQHQLRGVRHGHND